ncbi:hypothetical protein GGI17_006044 [Coemansia sp. S146]|nr:hypothetical protein GGI17_006044 [Coemansia sp. S146]
MPVIQTLVKLFLLRTTYYIVIIASYGLLYGLDTTAISGTLSKLKDRYRLNAMQIEYLGASTSLGAILGLLLFIVAASRFSRKSMLLMSSLVYATGSMLVGVSTNYTMCIVGRTVIGVALGVSSMIAPVYIGELSPKEFRGLFITFNMVAINLGMPVGYTLIMVLNVGENCSLWAFIINSLLCLCLAALLFMLVPNSPRDLIYRGKFEEAKAVIRQLNHPKLLSEEDIASQADSLKKAIQSEEGLSPKFSHLFNVSNRKALAISCMLQVAKQSSGFSALQYFSVYLFKILGLTKTHASQLPIILLGLVQFLAAAASLGIIDRLGRKRLLLISTISMAAGLVVLGGSFVAITGFDQVNKSSCVGYTRCGSCLLDTACGWETQTGLCLSRQPLLSSSSHLSYSCPMDTVRSRAGSWLAVASIIFSLGAFSLGLGSIPWVIQSEMFSQALRSKAGAVAAISNWIFSYIWTVSFLHLAFVMTLPVIFWLYAFLVVAAIASVYWAIPETTGIALEDIARDASYSPTCSLDK